MPRSALGRSFLFALTGLFAYGGWAYFVNASHGHDLALMIGAVQGSYSFALTFAMTLMTEWFYRVFDGHVAVILPVVCAFLFVTPYAIHLFIGTPEVLMTILPGFLIGSIYTGIYVVGLKRMETAMERGST